METDEIIVKLELETGPTVLQPRTMPHSHPLPAYVPPSVQNMASNNRKRSPNWLPSEKSLLVDLVENYFNIIENKKIDSATMKQKLTGWSMITAQYNSQTADCTRTTENLKTQWESLKKQARRDDASMRIYSLKTGGGLCLKKEDPLHSRIISLIKTTAVGPVNSFENECILPEIAESKITESPVILPEEQASSCNDFETDVEENEKNTEETMKQDCSDDTTKLLKNNKLSKPLQFNKIKEGELKNKSFISRRRPTYVSSLSLEQLHKKKIEAIDFQKSVTVKKTMNSNEIHKWSIRIKREQLRQEKIKTRILLLDLRIRQKHLRNKH